MARPETPLDRDGTPLRDFAFWLRDLRGRTALTYDQLAKRTGYSTSTLQDALAGRRLPTLTVVMAIVNACGGDEQPWHTYWTQVRRALDRDVPPSLTQTITPPWAVQATEPTGKPARLHPRDDQPVGSHTQSAAPRPSDIDSWYVASFSALLRLDTDAPEAVEERVIVATADDVSELTTSISVPRHAQDASNAHGLEAELLYGGSLVLREQPYESYFQYVIALAQPLKSGDRHEYAMRLRLPPDQPMAPHYVFVPLHRCDRFRLRIRFDTASLPPSIWKLDRAPTAVIYERGPGNEILSPDRFGEIDVVFNEIRLGYGYGVCWQG